MNENTRKIIILATEGDETINAETKSMLLDVLDGKPLRTHEGKLHDRILTRQEVADRFHCSVQMVDYYCRNGYICPVSITGKQAQGYLESSVDEAMRVGSIKALKWRKRLSAQWTPEKRAERSRAMRASKNRARA